MKRIAIAAASFMTTIAAYAAYVGVMADTTTGTVALPALEARIAKWAAITDHPTTLAGYGILDAPTWQQMIDYVVANTTPIGATNEPAFVGWTNQWHAPIVAHLAITNGNPHGVTAAMLNAVTSNDFANVVATLATTVELAQVKATIPTTNGFATTVELAQAVASLASTVQLAQAVAPLASTAQLAQAVAPLVSTSSTFNVTTGGTVSATSFRLVIAGVTSDFVRAVSANGTTNTADETGLLDLGTIGGTSGTSITGLTINVGTDNNLTPDHAYVFGTRCGATGENAVAMGYRASSIHSNTFVWADHSSESAFNDFGPNTFSVRASGGAYFCTSNLYVSSFDGTNWINRKVPTSNDVINITSNYNTSTFIPYTLSSELASEILWEFNTSSGPEHLTHVSGDIADRWINFETGQIEGFQIIKDGTNIVSLSIDAYNNSIGAIRVDTGTTYNVDTECFNIRSGGVFRVWNQGNAEFQANLTSEYIPWLMFESYAGFTFMSHNSASSDDELWFTKYYPQENTSSNVLATIHADIKSSSILLKGTNITDVAGQIASNVVFTGTYTPVELASSTNIQLLATNNPVKHIALSNIAYTVIWMPTKTNQADLIFGTIALYCSTVQVAFTNGANGINVSGVTAPSTTTNNLLRYYSIPGDLRFFVETVK